MHNYFYSLSPDLQNFIIYINKSLESVIKIKNCYKRYIKRKVDLIPCLINDLRLRNNCWKFRNPMIDAHESNFNGELIPIIPEDIDDISPTDPYTNRILILINRLIIGNEFYGKNPLICQQLWNRFLWALAMGIWRNEYTSNMGYSYFEKSSKLYYDLRLKTGNYAFKYNSSLLNLSPLFIN